MATATEICNLALSRIGERQIQDIDQEGNDTASICRTLIESARRKVLAEHPWSSATKRRTLARLPSAPAFEYKYAYKTPSDMVRIHKIVTQGGLPYRKEGQQILTDSESVGIIYTFDNKQYATLDSFVVDLIVIELARLLALPKAGKRKLEMKQMFDDEYWDQKYLAMSLDDQQNPAPEWRDADLFLSERL